MPLSVKNVLDETENLLILFIKSQRLRSFLFKNMQKKTNIQTWIAGRYFLKNKVNLTLQGKLPVALVSVMKFKLSSHHELKSSPILKKFPLEICNINYFLILYNEMGQHFQETYIF